MSYLVNVWGARLYHEAEARKLEHEVRTTSVELLAMRNRPQRVLDMNKLRDNVYNLMGVKP